MSTQNPFDKFQQNGNTPPKSTFMASDKVQELKEVLKNKEESYIDEPTNETELNPVTELEAKLAETTEKLTETQDRLLRTAAEVENFKKRMERDKEESITLANERLLKELLPVLDHLELTCEHARKALDDQKNTTPNSLVEGAQMVLKQFGDVLQKFGVSTKGAIGETFDPNVHEAVGMVENKDHPSNTVVAVLRKGYSLHHRLIRPALVSVSQ